MQITVLVYCTFYSSHYLPTVAKNPKHLAHSLKTASTLTNKVGKIFSEIMFCLSSFCLITVSVNNFKAMSLRIIVNFTSFVDQNNHHQYTYVTVLLVCPGWPPVSLCVEHMACCLFGAMCSHVDCLSPPILLLNHCFSGSSCVSLVTLVCLPI